MVGRLTLEVNINDSISQSSIDKFDRFNSVLKIVSGFLIDEAKILTKNIYIL